MSKLSRNRNINSKSIQFAKFNELTDDDEDFVVLPKSKPKRFEDQSDVKGGKEEASNVRDSSVIVIDDEADPVSMPAIPGSSTSASVYFSNDPPIKNSISNRLQPAKEKKIENPVMPALCEVKKFEPLVPISNEPEVDGDPELTTKDKVVCPFCWKKLSDKLTGMSHVKNCGKDLPTDRIFDALQLHEKQIREWEYLGIAYPGFQQNQIAGKVKATTAKQVRGKGNGRKKKDPELDLALALSASLHEEIEDRKRKEKEYLVEIGLEHELKAEDKDLSAELKEHRKAISDARSKFRIRFGKETKIKLPKTLPGKANGLANVGGEGTDNGKRRAPKTKTIKSQLTETPLYKTSDAQKQALLSSRVAEIIENSEKENKVVKIKYRTTELALPLVANKRLEKYTQKECPLWNMASCEDQRNEDFYTPALIESQSRNEIIIQANSKVSTTSNSVNPVTANDKICRVASGPVSDPTKSYSDVADVKSKPKDTLQVQPAKDLRKQSTKGRRSEKFEWNPVDGPDISNVEKDLLRLFVGKVGSDLTLYGTEEIPIRAHKLIITARCPKLLDEIVIEETGNGKRRELIPITSFSHAAVKSFLWCIYSGRFLPPSGTPDDVKIKEQINEMCKLYNLQCPVSSVTAAPTISQQHQSISEITSCKYVEKSVQTDVPQDESYLPSPIDVSTPLESSSQNFRRLSRRELDLQTVKENEFENVNVFEAEDSDDAIILCEIQSSNNKDAITSSSPGPMCGFDGVDGNVSNDGSCDLFEEYFPEEAAEKVIKCAQKEDSIKKRSRSVSPSIDRSEDIFNNTQANKKYKLSSDCTEGDAINLDNSPKPPVITLDDSIGQDACEISRPLNFSNSPEFVNDIDFSDKHIKKSLPQKCVSNGVSNETSLTPPSLAHSPLSRNSFSQFDKLPARSFRLSQISERFRTSCRTSLKFSPKSDFGTNKILSPPLAQLDPWDTDDTLLSGIPDAVLGIPAKYLSQPPPDTHLLESEPEPTSSIPETIGKPKGKKKERTASKEKGIQRNSKGAGKKVVSASQQPTTSHVIGTPDHIDHTRSQPSRTPLLNYSTIDTPILKGELKKYGLKPQPRSKAKLLLRHIYAETHK